MQDREHPLSRWFGERKIVRLMLLAALLTLGVIHFEKIVGFVELLWKVSSPLITGAVIAYILDIIVKRLEKLLYPNTKNKWLDKSRRIVSILLAAVLVISFFVLLFSTVIPGLADAFTVLGREFPNYFADVKKWVMETFRDVPAVLEVVEPLELDWPTIQNRVANWAINGVGRDNLLSTTATVISAITGSVANILISSIFAIFLLTSKKTLQSQFRHVVAASVTQRNNNLIQHVLGTANRCFAGFIVGQTLNGLILGILTWLGMRIFGMPYPLMVAVLSGTTSLVPIIGGYIGAALGTFLVFTADSSLAIWFLIFIVTLQNIQGNLLYPRMVGNSVGLPSLWVLAAVSIGGGLGGVGGMMVSVPITATIYCLTHEWVQKKRAEEQTAEKTDAANASPKG